MLRCLLLVILFGSSAVSYAQSLAIPGNTGYAVPAENDDQLLFSEKEGLHNWKNPKQVISYYFFARNKGILALSLQVKNARPGSKVTLSIAGKNFPVVIPASQSFVSLKVGEVLIPDTGYYQISLAGFAKEGNTIADIKSIGLSGPASVDCHFNTKSRRNAASVHLRYPLPDTVKAIAFYNELTIPAGADHLYSYYMACGFARGYFGIQVNSKEERRVIFSVWDAGKEAMDRNKVADSNKVQLLAKGDAVIADGFGNEGTGGHSHWVYPWQTNQTYQFLVTAVADPASRKTIYTGYFYIPEKQQWKLIASFKAPADGQGLTNLYSFNENFIGTNGQLQRKAFFGNQWVQLANGKWTELTNATFSYDATGKAGDRLDYGAGITQEGKFYLANGGQVKSNVYLGEAYNRPATNQRPVVDVTKNADSTLQAVHDQQMILKAVRDNEFDTTGSRDGVYYHILEEGNGSNVAVADTVTVYYKGSLLSDGSVFDQTKDKPATFPLSRLIKGWQIGLPFCKTGGKIRLLIPSGQAYSIRSRSKDIPPNSVLVFDITVVSVKKANP